MEKVIFVWYYEIKRIFTDQKRSDAHHDAQGNMGRFLQENRYSCSACLDPFLYVQNHIYKGRGNELLYVWLCCGIPFGIRRMFVWLVPHGYDTGGTFGIIALNFIVGGLIGGVILVWRLVVAAWYVLLTVYRLITFRKTDYISVE